MPKIKFSGTWTLAYHKKLNIPKGFVLVKYNDSYQKDLAKVLMKLDEVQNKQLVKLKESGEKYEPGDHLRELDFDLEYHYRKRTLDQNNLMWALYSIEANEMNGGQSGHRNQVVDPEELYLNDLDEWGERETITTRRKHYGQYADDYKIIEAVIVDDGREYNVNAFLKLDMDPEDRITLRVIRGTSKFNTKEMAYWIDRIFNRLAYNGVQVTNPGNIKSYWLKWRQGLNDEQIIVRDEILTQKEYKALNPICEGCGEPVIDRGELHHIKTVGMGNNREDEPKKNYSSNWLCLCHECHIEEFHKKGVEAFKKKHKHLVYKINTALNRDYEPIPGMWEDTIPGEFEVVEEKDEQKKLEIF